MLERIHQQISSHIIMNINLLKIFSRNVYRLNSYPWPTIAYISILILHTCYFVFLTGCDMKCKNLEFYHPCQRTSKERSHCSPQSKNQRLKMLSIYYQRISTTVQAIRAVIQLRNNICSGLKPLLKNLQVYRANSKSIDYI